MQDKNRRDALRYASVGVEFILTFGLAMAGGLWLDGRLGTTPGFMLLGGAAGFALGLYRLIRQARDKSKNGCDEGGSQ